MRIIDTHTHVISSDIQKYPLNPIGGKQSDWSATRPVTDTELLRAMDEAGVDTAIVVQASTAYGHDNSYVAASVAAHPDRFAGVFSVDMLSASAVQDIRKWTDAGLVGLRLFTTGSTMPGQSPGLDDPRSFPGWAYCEAHDIPVCLQMTMDGIPALQNILKQFPKIRVLLDHFARPNLSAGTPYTDASALFALAEQPGVYLKLTDRTIRQAASGRSTHADFFARVLTSFGAKRVAWGSNFPSAEGSLKILLADAKAALSILTEADQAQILSGTAASIYHPLPAWTKRV
ncbi:MAG: amidohydrolase [Acidocella sp. 20-57-95]|nr:MAG: amidohydrolase [Acidocella sp. 20-57-95]HQT63843.1 amidohydrolase family protein [Acidocella sp.]